MFLDKALRDLLLEELEAIRTRHDDPWLTDAFGFLNLERDNKPVFDEIIKYFKHEKINVYYELDRGEPMLPCVIVTSGSGRSNMDLSLGDSRGSVVLSGGVSKVQREFETTITGVRLICVTRNPDLTLYLWYAVQLIVLANAINLARWYGEDADGFFHGFHSISCIGEQTTYRFEGQAPLGQAFGRDVSVEAKFICRVAERTRNYPVTAITAQATTWREKDTDPYQEGTYT